MRLFLLLVGLVTAAWLLLSRPAPPPAAPPAPDPQQRRLQALAEGEARIRRALEQGADPLRLGGEKEALLAARSSLAALAQETGSFGPFYVLKYHLAWLDDELDLAPPPAERPDFDDLERSGYAFFYGKDRTHTLEMLETLATGRSEDVNYWEPEHPTLRAEAVRQLGNGLFTGQRSYQRQHLFESMRIRGLTVVDYACGTGVALPGLLQEVGEDGTVYAVDVAPSVLDFIADRAQHDPRLVQLRRVKLVHARPTDSGLPTDSVDVIFLDGYPLQPRNTDVYEAEVRPLAANLLRILKPGGRLVVWPYSIPDEEMAAIMAEAGFGPAEVAPMGGRDPAEHALMFRKPSGR